MAGVGNGTEAQNGEQEALSGPFRRAHDGPQQQPHSELSTVIGRLAASSDVVFLADTDHNDGSLKKPLADPAFLAAARRAGVTDIYIELATELQRDVDALTRGAIDKGTFVDRTAARHMDEYTARYPDKDEDGELIYDPEEMRRRMGEFADVTVAAAKAGLKVHAADAQPIAEVVEISHLMITEEYGDVFEKMRERRRVYDPVVAEDINATREGKALVAYGAEHLGTTALGNYKSRIDNMDEALERNGTKTSTVILTGNTPQNWHEGLKELQRAMPNEFETPEYIYNPAMNEGLTPAAPPPAPSAAAPPAPARTL